MLNVEPASRGQGLGRHLTAECIHFARDKGYRGLVLWTNASLEAAKYISATSGSRLVAEEPQLSFGKEPIIQS